MAEQAWTMFVAFPGGCIIRLKITSHISSRHWQSKIKNVVVGIVIIGDIIASTESQSLKAVWCGTTVLGTGRLDWNEIEGKVPRGTRWGEKILVCFEPKSG